MGKYTSHMDAMGNQISHFENFFLNTSNEQWQLRHNPLTLIKSYIYICGR